jgi:hypothetical protein
VSALSEAEVRLRLLHELRRKGRASEDTTLSPTTAGILRQEKEAKWEAAEQQERWAGGQSQSPSSEVRDLRHAVRELTEQLEEAHARTMEAERIAEEERANAFNTVSPGLEPWKVSWSKLSAASSTYSAATVDDKN